MRYLIQRQMKRRRLQHTAVVEVLSIHCRVLPGASQHRVEVTHQIEMVERRDGYLAIDCGRWPLPLLGVRLDDVEAPNVAGSLLLFQIPHAGPRLTLFYAFGLPRAENPLGALVAVPAALPGVLRREVALSRSLSVPAVELTLDGGIDDVAIARHSFWPQRLAPGDVDATFCVTIASDANYTWHGAGHGVELAVSDAVGSALGEERIPALYTVVDRVANSCARLFGTTKPKQLIVATPAALVQNRGADYPGSLFLSEEELAQCTNHSFGLYFEVARQLGLAWWGGACSVLGPGSQEIETGIVTAASLLVAAELSVSDVPPEIPWYFEKLSRRFRALDALDWLRGWPPKGRDARVTLGIYRAEKRRSGLLARLTEMCFGRMMPRSQLRGLLAEWGIEGTIE